VLEKYSPKPLENEAGLPEPQSCTSEKTWGPRKRDVTPKIVMSTTVELAKDSLECKKVAVTCTLYEARGDEAKNITAAKIVFFKYSLHNDSHFSVLPENSSEVEFIKTTHGVVPKGSLLAYQLSKNHCHKKENQ